MAEKTPDVFVVLNNILTLMEAEYSSRIIKAEDMLILSMKVNELCGVYSRLPKVRTRKSKAQKQAEADVVKATGVDNAE